VVPKLNELKYGIDVLVELVRSFRARLSQGEVLKERERERRTGRRQARISRGFI
jgi:hypothetical protein